MNKRNLSKLLGWIAKRRILHIESLAKDLLRIADETECQTGFKAKGDWYVFFGPV